MIKIRRFVGSQSRKLYGATLPPKQEVRSPHRVAFSPMTLHSHLEWKATGRVAVQPLLSECRDVYKTVRHCREITWAKGDFSNPV